MFKELQRIFKRKSLMEEALLASREMLQVDWEMFDTAVKSLREQDTVDFQIEIYDKDQRINEYEREVRKKVLTHLAVSGVTDLSIGLVLTSIVIDIERIGDYTKNIVELAMNHPQKLTANSWEPVIKRMESTVSESFGTLLRALRESDTNIARSLLEKLWEVKRQCDKYVLAIIHGEEIEFSAPDAATLILYLRYLKRIASHLANIATSIVNPFHRIGYKEEEEID